MFTLAQTAGHWETPQSYALNTCCEGSLSGAGLDAGVEVTHPTSQLVDVSSSKGVVWDEFPERSIHVG